MLNNVFNIAKWCFAGVALAESILILNDAGTAEVMVTPIWSLQEIRVALVLGSLLALSVLSLVIPEDA